MQSREAKDEVFSIVDPRLTKAEVRQMVKAYYNNQSIPYLEKMGSKDDFVTQIHIFIDDDLLIQSARSLDLKVIKQWPII